MFYGAKSFTSDLSKWASVAALTPITNANIGEAVALWKSDKYHCFTTYGNISFWDTGSVTNMDYLFCGGDSSNSWNDYKCSRSKADFNEDISQWDVSNVKSMMYVSMRARLSSAHRSP